jgi:predicted ABC-type ATPase
MAIERVKFRVSQGGHNITEQDIVRRFDRSWKNFIQYYKSLSDSWIVCDSSGKYPVIIDQSGR